MRFSLKQPACFVAAGEAGSILRAAENTHVSQPSISNAVAHLDNIRRTIVVDIFSQFCHQQISADKIPGMASL